MSTDIGIAGTSFAALPFLNRLKDAGLAVRPMGTLSGAVTADLDGPEIMVLVPRDIMESEALLFEAEAYARMPWVRLIVISGTLSPRYTRALRARIPARVALVDAPFVGSHRQVELALPSFLLGGEAEALDRIQPLIDILGHGSVRMGGFGSAMAAKVLQDCLAAATSAMTRSALEWAEAQGIEETRLVSLLEASFGPNLPRTVTDPASLVTNALPGDDAGIVLVKKVESAIDAALAGVHLNPPRSYARSSGGLRARHLH